MFTLALLLACGDKPAGTTADNRVTPDDIHELLDRVEQLEAEIVALRSAGAPVGIDADADGDGLREWDGLPVGTRRGDVLYDWTCSAAGEVPPAAPGWMVEAAEAQAEDDRLPLVFGCFAVDPGHSSQSWGDCAVPSGVWHATMHEEDVGAYKIQCLAL